MPSTNQAVKDMIESLDKFDWRKDEVSDGKRREFKLHTSEDGSVYQG